MLVRNFSLFLVVILNIRGNCWAASFNEEFAFMKKQVQSLFSRLEKAETKIEELSAKLHVSEEKNELLLERLGQTGNRSSDHQDCGELFPGLNAGRVTRKSPIKHGNIKKEHLEWMAVSVHSRQLLQSQHKIAFSARRTSPIAHLGVHQIVIYDKEISDTLSAYNNADGIFTAPLTGMYVFLWTTAVASWEATELVVDSTAVGFVEADTTSGDDPDYGSASQTVVVKVNKGQHVFVRTADGDGNINGRRQDNTFSGWFLFEQ